jgi:hypothetical protein
LTVDDDPHGAVATLSRMVDEGFAQLADDRLAVYDALGEMRSLVEGDPGSDRLRQQVGPIVERLDQKAAELLHRQDDLRSLLSQVGELIGDDPAEPTEGSNRLEASHREAPVERPGRLLIPRHLRPRLSAALLVVGALLVVAAILIGVL